VQRTSSRRIGPRIAAIRFIVLASVVAVAAQAAETTGENASFPFAEATIEQLQARMQAGELTAHALTSAYLARIAAIDHDGPQLRSVIETNPDALAIATRLDAERAAGKVRGPLHGIPVLIKDNIATADRMETTAGSLALVGARPPRDAALVTRLREAGAVILGKTNLSEWANLRDERSVSGWSARGGQTRHPYALDRNPSGSSSGSGVAVSANLCVVAVGTETDGSIICPSSANGIVGVKPTVGLISRAGIIPISVSQDTAGPMARTVRDAAILLGILAGEDAADAATAARPVGSGTDFAAGLGQPVLRGARVGVVRGAFGFPPKVDPVLASALETLRAAGAELIEVGTMPAISDVWEPEFEVLLYEFKDGLNAYLATLGEHARVKSLADIIAFNEAHRTQELSLFGQSLLVKAEAKGPLTDAAYLEARATCLRLMRTEGLDALFETHRLDTIVTISSGPAWLTDPVNGDAYTGASTTAAAVAGYPSVTVPAGAIAGLPVGLSFTGRAWSDARQLELAADFEAHANARRLPPFQTTIEVP